MILRVYQWFAWSFVLALSNAASAFAQPAPLNTDPAIRSGLKIEQAWVRLPPANATVAGGYLIITNTGSQADRLIGGTFDSAKAVEVHEMSMVDGVMKMAALSDGLEIKPGQTVTLKPGSYHLMLMGLMTALKQGEAIKGTLTFEKAGTIPISYVVQPIDSSPTNPAMTGGAHKGH